MKKLKCYQCDSPLLRPRLEKKPRLFQAALNGERPTFCDKSCASKYAHANRSAEAKTKRLESNRKTRGLSPKICPVCSAEFYSKRKQYCSSACWYTYTKTRDPAETKAIYEKREATNAAKPARVKEAERQAHLAALPTSVGGPKLEAWKRKLKRTDSQKVEMSERAKAWWKTLSSDERANRFKERSAKWFALPETEKEVVRSKLRDAAARRSPEQKQATAYKLHQAKKANGSYVTSKAEQYIKHRLRCLLGEQVVHLFRDHPDYRWEADFYDPATNTIFEFQGFPSHGGCAFDRNNKEHKRRLKELRTSKEWLPKLTAEVWASTDVRKRQDAKQAGVNFVEWFTKKQFDDWEQHELAKMLRADELRDGWFFRDGVPVARSWKSLPVHAAQPVCVYYPWDDLRKVAVLAGHTGPVLYARKLDVVNVSVKLADKFCDRYHLQKSCKGTTLAVGIVDRTRPKPALLGVMTFGKPRYNKNYDHELLRLCFRARVVGGSSRMFKHALSQLDGSVISYCDLAKFQGSVYTELGFKKLKAPRPSVHWYNPTTGQHITDNLLRQHGFDRLVGKAIGVVYGAGTSNGELMVKHGFTPIKDMGQATFVYERER